MTKEEQRRAYRMVHMLNDCFYLAQIIGLGEQATDKRITAALDKMMTTVTSFYKSPAEAAEDFFAFANQVNVKTKLELEINGQRVPKEIN